MGLLGLTSHQGNPFTAKAHCFDATTLRVRYPEFTMDYAETIYQFPQLAGFRPNQIFIEGHLVLNVLDEGTELVICQLLSGQRCGEQLLCWVWSREFTIGYFRLLILESNRSDGLLW